LGERVIKFLTGQRGLRLEQRGRVARLESRERRQGDGGGAQETDSALLHKIIPSLSGIAITPGTVIVTACGRGRKSGSGFQAGAGQLRSAEKRRSRRGGVEGAIEHTRPAADVAGRLPG